MSDQHALCVFERIDDYCAGVSKSDLVHAGAVLAPP